MSEPPSTSARVGRATMRAARWSRRFVRGQVVELVGGPARARVIVLFGCVLGLNSAATATIGAVAPELKHALSIGNPQIGLLSSISLLVGAVFVVPVGLLVDRTKRIPLLCIGIVLWSIASFVGALAGSYEALLLSRLALGAVAATAGPAIASLTGDYFAASERGNVYAYILVGEILGTAAGFIVAGDVATIVSWRVSFVLLALPGFFLARSLWRTVPEPQRDGQSRLHVGAESFEDAGGPEVQDDDQPLQEDNLAHEAASRRGVRPNPRLILREDPDSMSLWRAVRYILSIPTNTLMIISSSLGYFYFSGLQTFAVLFVVEHYKAGPATANLVLGLLIVGMLVGTLTTGWLTDLMLRNGILQARIWTPALCYIGAAGLLIPGILISKLTPALWFDVGGAALLTAANPPLDAARLDIMPARLWGRAESTRTFLRSLAQAIAPLLFGALSALIAGSTPEQTPVGTHAKHAGTGGAGLELSFLIMLITLFAAGWFLIRCRHTYPTDVASAAASQRRGAPVRPAGPGETTAQTRVL
ncbi:MAG: MFS transporter [Solirubrobacteraceae bacterium]